jgi:phage baseplate assembly protein W
MKSLKAPFRLDGGGVSSLSDPGQIAEQKIVNCLTTGRFERTGLPYYGAGASSLVMEDIDELIERDFVTDAKQALNASVSGVNIHSIKVREDPYTPGQANILVSFSTPLTAPRTVTLTLDNLTEESGF